MNIQDRIAKLEKELAELKGELEWTPRKGEIVKFSNDGVQWRTGKIVGYNYSKDYVDDDENVMYYEDDYGDNWNYCHPLNDPMVIQLIPHVPGDPVPKWNGEALYITRAGDYYIDSVCDLFWGENEEQTITSYYLIP